ncbi:MAG: hypothetical protein J7501_03685 [Bdellovibrio sp.]|nr:hypothetical protein [Bdellovibrio sp.]
MRNFLEIHCLQNLMTEFELIKNLKTKPLEIFEFDDRCFSFQAPQKMCGLGLFVHLEGFMHIANEKHDFYATGKVTSTDTLESEKLSKYTIELHRFDKSLWEEFRKAVEQTQAATDTLFKSMKDSE